MPAEIEIEDFPIIADRTIANAYKLSKSHVEQKYLQRYFRAEETDGSLFKDRARGRVTMLSLADTEHKVAIAFRNYLRFLAEHGYKYNSDARAGNHILGNPNSPHYNQIEQEVTQYQTPTYSVFRFSELEGDCRELAIGFGFALISLGLDPSKISLTRFGVVGNVNMLVGRGTNRVLTSVRTYSARFRQHIERAPRPIFRVLLQGNSVTTTPLDVDVGDQPFNEHYALKFNGTYYDATYGVSYRRPLDFLEPLSCYRLNTWYSASRNKSNQAMEEVYVDNDHTICYSTRGLTNPSGGGATTSNVFLYETFGGPTKRLPDTEGEYVNVPAGVAMALGFFVPQEPLELRNVAEAVLRDYNAELSGVFQAFRSSSEESLDALMSLASTFGLTPGNAIKARAPKNFGTGPSFFSTVPQIENFFYGAVGFHPLYRLGKGALTETSDRARYVQLGFSAGKRLRRLIRLHLKPPGWISELFVER